MSHCSAVLHPPLLPFIHLVFIVAALCVKTETFFDMDRWGLWSEVQSEGMLEVNRFFYVGHLWSHYCHQRLLLYQPLNTVIPRHIYMHTLKLIQPRYILYSLTPTCTNSHRVIAALLFGFEEAHGEEAASLQAQNKYDASDEAGHVKLGLGELRGWFWVAAITWRERDRV